MPFQSDGEIEKFLAEAEIVESSVLGRGVTLPRKLTLEMNGVRAQAIFKEVDVSRRKVTEIINGRSWFSLDWRDWHGFDTAAYVLDRLLDLDRVPPAIPRSIDSDPGTITIWLEKTVNDVERSQKHRIPPPDSRRWNQQLAIMQVFDNLVANRDSNFGNLLIDANWRLWFVDCTRCFGKTKSMYYPLKEITHCERNLWNGLRNLDPATARDELSPFLDPAEIKALLKRRDIIVRHFQKLIDEKGEGRVLYDVVPPTTTAPWGDD
jgi:hypothetical protein